MREIMKIEERGISPKKKEENVKKEKNAFSDNHMLNSWFKFQLDSSSGVDCSERTYTNTYIHKYIVIV